MVLYIACSYIYISVRSMCRPWGRVSSGETSCPLSICPYPTDLSTSSGMTSRSQKPLKQHSLGWKGTPPTFMSSSLEPRDCMSQIYIDLMS